VLRPTHIISQFGINAFMSGCDIEIVLLAASKIPLDTARFHPTPKDCGFSRSHNDNATKPRIPISRLRHQFSFSRSNTRISALSSLAALYPLSCILGNTSLDPKLVIHSATGWRNGTRPNTGGHGPSPSGSPVFDN
jgi:hypothetical protein